MSGREVRIKRHFGAPPDVVFRAWTDPEQVVRWWAPDGFEIPRGTVQIEARVGGRIHFSMSALEGGAEYPVRFEIVELVEPELLVLAAEAMPEEGLAHPTITRVMFEADGDGTTVTVTTGPHTDEMVPRALAGWNQSLDKLGSLVGA
jgi:uncharacterized protein YndB with AHSA1/START domain